jgi:hypothetical protein
MIAPDFSTPAAGARDCYSSSFPGMVGRLISAVHSKHLPIPLIGQSEREVGFITIHVEMNIISTVNDYCLEFTFVIVSSWKLEVSEVKLQCCCQGKARTRNPFCRGVLKQTSFVQAPPGALPLGDCGISCHRLCASLTGATTMTQSVPSSNAYSYEPLPVFHSFRTLELFAGGPSDLRRGRLRAHYNDPSVSYEILSYTWGNATLTHSIYIGDSVMPITTSLHSALVRLRYLDKPRVLWRDGICTNLKDNSERGKRYATWEYSISTQSK